MRTFRQRFSVLEEALKKQLRARLPATLVTLLGGVRYPRRVTILPFTPTYNEDGLITYHNSDFVRDELFVRSYNKGAETDSWGGLSVRWRAHVCCWAASHAANLDGDFVECGVNKGGGALTVVTYLNFGTLRKTFHLLDTFCGLVEEQISQKERGLGATRTEGGMYGIDCYEAVLKTFESYPNVRIIKGAVPDTLELVTADKVAYLSLDMNCAAPEIAAAEFFWDKLVAGAVIVLDDYGYSQRYIEQKKAFDKFAADRGTKVLSLPTGQGLILKP